MNGKLSCIGRCNIYKATRRANESPYDSGLGYCKTCSVYVKVDCLLCPCCNNRLRFKPKNKNRRKVLQFA